MAEKKTSGSGTTSKFDIGSILNNKKGLWAGILSLIVGLGVGTTLGQEVLGKAGVPVSCVRALQRGDTAISTGTGIGDAANGALDAVKGLRIGEAGDLLGDIPGDVSRLFNQAKKFQKSYKTCNAERD